MAAWIYYREERERHSVAGAINVDLDRAIALIDHLSDLASVTEFKEGYRAQMGKTFIDRVALVINPRQRGWSYYYHRYGKRGPHLMCPLITMDTNAMNVRVIVHEWAHHASRRLYEARNRYLHERNLRLPKYRYHDDYHRELVDWGIEAAGKFLGVAVTKPEAQPLFNVPPEPEDGIYRVAAEHTTEIHTTDRENRPVVVAVLPKFTSVTLPAFGYCPPVPVILSPVETFFRSLPDYLDCPHCGKTLLKVEFGVRVMKRDEADNPIKMAPQSYCRSCRSKKAN